MFETITEETIEALEKERNARHSLSSLFPDLSDGNEDNVIYELISYPKDGGEKRTVIYAPMQAIEEYGEQGYSPTYDSFASWSPELLQKYRKEKKKKAGNSIVKITDKARNIDKTYNKHRQSQNNIINHNALTPKNNEANNNLPSNIVKFNKIERMNNLKKINSESRINPWYLEHIFDEAERPVIRGPLNREIRIKGIRPSYTDFEKVNKAKFNSLMPYSLNFEGGYSNHKHDKGGETKYGITKVFYDTYKAKVPDISPTISGLTTNDAIALYKAQWDKYKLGRIRDKRVAFTLHDYMINSDAKGVIERLQEYLNTNGANLKPDGIVGDKTLNAINQSNPHDICKFLLSDRKEHYLDQAKKNKTQTGFINGWINRINDISEIIGLGRIF